MIKKARILYLIHLILLVLMVGLYITDYNRDMGLIYLLWVFSALFLLVID